uniref:Ig-like domain-containing protein n=1 Tax=Spermophilus dauricus TaxID=99837 RepID=A0A8C9QLS8_SPEDA
MSSLVSIGLCRVLLLLAATAFWAPLCAAAGSYSLRYNLKMRSQNHLVHRQFFAEGLLDDQPFLHYDSERDRAEPQALWAKTVLGAETWNTETQDLAGSGKNLRMTLADIIRSLQKVHPSSAQTLAMEVKKHWKSDDSPSKAQWAHVQGTICGRLQRYLNSWIAFNKTIVSPVVTVTCGEALEDTINATCRAFGFYPWIISLTWLQDGEPLSQDTQQSGSLLPYGNGTYQTCVSTRIPQGQEQRYTCHVRHSGKESAGTVPCGEPGCSQLGRSVTGVVKGRKSRGSGTQMVTCVFSGSTLLLRSRWRASLGVVAAVDAVLLLLLLYVLWSNRRETISAAEGSGKKSGQWMEMAGSFWVEGSLMPHAAQSAVEVTRLLEQADKV